MNEYAERLKPFYHFAEKILFPVILIQSWKLCVLWAEYGIVDTADVFVQCPGILLYEASVRRNHAWHEGIFLPADQCHGPAWIPLFPDENAGCHCLSCRAFRNWNVLVSIRDFI